MSMLHMAPPLSVILSSCETWPKLNDACRHLFGQAAACGAEVIVAVSGMHCLPSGGADAIPGSWPGVRVISAEGANIFELRALAVSRALGDIVALLEDHNFVPATWCARLLEQYAKHPECDSVVGAIVNGTEATRTDRANFLQNFGSHLSAPGQETARRIPTIAGSSFRRRALATCDGTPGYLELVLFAEISARGAVRFDAENAVSHVQSNPLRRTLMNHFHNGRACAGLLRGLQRGHSRWYGFAVACGLPLIFLYRWLFGEGRQVLGRDCRDCLPHLFAIGLAYGAGSAAGWLAGPGRSPWELE